VTRLETAIASQLSDAWPGRRSGTTASAITVDPGDLRRSARVSRARGCGPGRTIRVVSSRISGDTGWTSSPSSARVLDAGRIECSDATSTGARLLVTYFHVRLTVEGSRHDEVKLDLDEEDLERQILDPYRRGAAITINGTTIPVTSLRRIRISSSDALGAELIEAVKRDDRASSVAMLGGPDYTWRAASRGKDVTDQFITGPAGSLAEDAVARAVSPAEEDGRHGPVGEPSADSVFLVCGRDSKANVAVTTFLQSLGLGVGVGPRCRQDGNPKPLCR
jgi:hypothetical protein